MDELRQRGTVWWIRYYRNGRRFEESSRSTKWEAANRLLKQREGAVADGLPISPAIGRLKFEDAAAPGSTASGSGILRRLMWSATPRTASSKGQRIRP
jgi:hypothetical protein